MRTARPGPLLAHQDDMMPDVTESLDDPRPQRATAADPAIARDAELGGANDHANVDAEFDLRRAVDDARAYVQSHPMQALAGAAALGFLLAVAVRRA
jgi:hypothetical protein